MPSTTIFTLTAPLASSVAITIDVLAMANRVSHSLGRPSPFDVKIQGAGAALFRPFLAFPEATHDEPDLFILPAQGLSKAEDYSARLAEPDAAEGREAIRSAFQAGAHVASSCTGTLLLASSGR